MTLVSVPSEDKQALICTIEVYESGTLEPLKWKKNDGELNSDIQSPIQKTGESQSTMSVLVVSQDDWNENNVYTCEATYKSQHHKRETSKGIVVLIIAKH